MDDIHDFIDDVLQARWRAAVNELDENQRRLVLHGIAIAANSLRHIKAPMVGLHDLAEWMAGYADTLARAWGVKPDIAALEALMREIEKVPVLELTDLPDVASRPANNN
jgi:hypothetical protein